MTNLCATADRVPSLLGGAHPSKVGQGTVSVAHTTLFTISGLTFHAHKARASGLTNRNAATGEMAA